MVKWVQVQGKMWSDILKKSPIALTYNRIVEGASESKRSFMFWHRKKKTVSYISEFDTVDHDMLIDWFIISKFYGTSTPKYSDRSYSAKTSASTRWWWWYQISESTRKKCYGSTVWELHCLRIALCESIRYQANSEQNVRQDLIPRVHHGEAALCTQTYQSKRKEAFLCTPLSRHVEQFTDSGGYRQECPRLWEKAGYTKVRGTVQECGRCWITS